jgi:hypothetical protein
MNHGCRHRSSVLSPRKYLEFGFSRVIIFAGEGHVPLTFGSFWHSFTSFSNVPVSEKMSRNDPGERHSSFDFTWRLPGLTKWVTLYSDSIVHDDSSPIDAPRRAAVNPGIYISHFPDLPHLDLRVEGVNTDTPAGTINGGHFIYWEGQSIATATPTKEIFLEVGSGGKAREVRHG